MEGGNPHLDSEILDRNLYASGPHYLYLNLSMEFFLSNSPDTGIYFYTHIWAESTGFRSQSFLCYKHPATVQYHREQGGKPES